VRRWAVAVVLGLALLGGSAFARGAVPCDLVALQPTCDVALRPGPTEDTLRLVSVEGARSYASTGQLLLTTVAVQDDLSFRAWVDARTSRTVEAVPRDRIYPSGSDRDEVAEVNAAMMADSQLVATIAALRELGYELTGEGALVAAVTEGAVTDELQPGDLIVAVDGASVSDSRDAVDLVQAKRPGDTVELQVTGVGGERSVSVRLGRSPEDADIPFIGVLLTTQLDLPVEVTIDAGVIGGPSAGLMFALSIVDRLGADDLTGGAVIAGTGTVDRDGIVGAVGGVRQKLVGATDATTGARAAVVFLVPRANLEEARSAAVSRDVLLVPVDTLGEALTALADLRAGREPSDALALAASR
jgi:Lon-like protease